MTQKRAGSAAVVSQSLVKRGKELAGKVEAGTATDSEIRAFFRCFRARFDWAGARAANEEKHRARAYRQYIRDGIALAGKAEAGTATDSEIRTFFSNYRAYVSIYENTTENMFGGNAPVVGKALMRKAPLVDRLWQEISPRGAELYAKHAKQADPGEFDC